MTEIFICPDEQGENSDFFVNGASDYFYAIALYLLPLFDKRERFAKESLIPYIKVIVW